MESRPATERARASLSRRDFLRSASAAAVLLGAPSALLAGCGNAPAAAPRGRTLRIGFVTPSTGPLAQFAAADGFVIDGIRRTLEKGLDRSGTRHPVKILVRNAASTAAGAAEAASALIKQDRVDLMLTAQSPEIVNPVSSICEEAGVPCISSLSPWQPFYFGRGATPERGFDWTYHFFFGLDEFKTLFLDLWDEVETNKVVGSLWPADDDGAAFRDPRGGFPPDLKRAGYRLVDPGPYKNLTADFGPIIKKFKDADVQILTGVPLPEDFNRFWKQSSEMGFSPRVVSVGKALLFPSSVEALGPLAEGLTVEVWWSPSHPFNSSLTGESAKQLADSYTKATGKQWTQPLGFVHALFEVAIDALVRAKDVSDPAAVRDAVAGTNLETMVGPIAWSGRPVKNVATVNLVGGQWRRGSTFDYDITVVTNKALPQIPVQGQVNPLPPG